MKVFISQKMNGLTGKEITKARYEAVGYLRKRFGSVEIIDSYVTGFLGAGIGDRETKLWYLGESIKKMAEADMVYFCRGWRQASGCIIEYMACRFYGLPYMEQGKEKNEK